MAERNRQPGLFDATPRKPVAKPAAPAEQPRRAARPEPRILTVTQLSQEIASRLKSFGRVAVEGEVTGLKEPRSGHLYFDLKDESSLVRCAIWSSRRQAAVRFPLREGMRVVCHGALDLYKPRGTYSLLVERVEQKGIGELLARLEELKHELKGRGWFERARPLPVLPRRVGVVTSRDGAAFQDFLRTRSMRWPLYPLRLVHTAVQGREAAPSIAAAIRALDASGVDVIVVTRGGGALEDLWCFNERVVAEAIWNASVPVVSGVGHETDVTLADLVADVRAHTPTDAAQTVLPLRSDFEGELERLGGYLSDAIERLLVEREGALERLGNARVLRDATALVDVRYERLVDLRRRMQLATERLIEGGSARLAHFATRLARRDPAAELERKHALVDELRGRLTTALERRLTAADSKLDLAFRSLEATSPFAVLARGYSITRVAGATKPITDSAELERGTQLETILHAGRVSSTVDETSAGEDG